MIPSLCPCRSLWRIVLVVLTHEESPAEVIAQNFGLHQLAQRTAESTLEPTLLEAHVL